MVAAPSNTIVDSASQRTHDPGVGGGDAGKTVASGESVSASATPTKAPPAGGAAGSFPVETTWPDKEVRHSISDAELDMLHQGHVNDRASDKAFDVFLAACGAAAGAAPQVVKDFWGAFFAKQSAAHDIFGVVALLVFGGALALAFAMRLFWKQADGPSAVDAKVVEIRERTNRTSHLIDPAQPISDRPQ